MRSPIYQIEITRENVKDWIRKVEHSIRALKEDEKHGIEWTVLHRRNLQEDADLLVKFLVQYDLLQMMRDTGEWPDNDKAQ